MSPDPAYPPSLGIRLPFAFSGKASPGYAGNEKRIDDTRHYGKQEEHHKNGS